MILDSADASSSTTAIPRALDRAAAMACMTLPLFDRDAQAARASESVSADTRLGIVTRTSPSRSSSHLALTSVSAMI